MRYTRHMQLLAPLAMATALLSSPALARDDDNRFTLRLGAMNIDSDNTLRGTTVAGGRELSFDEDFGLGGKEWEPRVDGVLRLSPRQRLVFDYFKYDKDRRETLGQAVSYDGTTVPAGSFVKGQLKYQVASLVYDFAVVDSEAVSLGLQIGAEYAKVSADA